MAAFEPDDPENLLGRLKDVASGDTALRQLRRRYDTLRNDYETLLDRVDELEATLSAPEQARIPSAPAASSESRGIAEELVSPLLRLRDDYLSAAGGIQSIVEGLDSLAAAAFKGQRPAPPQPEPPAPPRTAPAREPTPERTRHVSVDVKAGDFGALLDFQEQLSGLAGVARVSIKAIDNERATLIVELAPGRS